MSVIGHGEDAEELVLSVKGRHIDRGGPSEVRGPVTQWAKRLLALQVAMAHEANSEHVQARAAVWGRASDWKRVPV